MSQFFEQARTYFLSCGWQIKRHEADSDGFYFSLLNKDETYLSYTYHDTKHIDFNVAKERLGKLESHPLKTKSTLLFCEQFNSCDPLEQFSTVFFDSNELSRLQSMKAKNPSYKHIQLQAHNFYAFKQYLANPEKKSAFVNATGTGKSYLIARISQHHYPSRIGILSSSNFILDQQESLIGNEDSIAYLSYYWTTLEHDKQDFFNNLDILIMDEFHRAGADTWEIGVNNIINANEGIEILGFSATHIRHLDDKRNMAEELFDNNVISALSLTESIGKGILPVPKYVSGIYDIEQTERSYQDRIASSKSATDIQKKESLETLNGLSIDWNRFGNASTILSDNMEDFTGKYVVFCENFVHMDLMKGQVKKWIEDAHQMKYGKPIGIDITIDDLNSERSDAVNKRTLDNFESYDSDSNMHLLFTVDMLNEGRHIPGISGAILLRRTMSPNIFYQQIGRAFEANDSYNPLIIDLVGNVHTIHKSIFSDDLEKSVSEGNVTRKKFGLPELDIVGKIIDYNTDIIGKLTEIESVIKIPKTSFEDQYLILLEYHETFGHLNTSVGEMFNDIDVHSLQEKVRTRIDRGTISEDEISMLEDIGFSFRQKKTTFEDRIALLKRYHDTFGNLDIKTTDVFEGENIGGTLRHLRTEFFNDLLSKEQIDQLESLNFVFYGNRDSEKEGLESLTKYYQEHGDLNIKLTDTYNGRDIGQDVRILRKKYKDNTLTKESIASLNSMDFVFSLKQSFEDSFALLKKYFDKHGHSDVKRGETYEGFKLDAFVANLRTFAKQDKLRDDQLELLNSVNFTFSFDTPFEEWMDLLKEFKDENGHVEPKSNVHYKNMHIYGFLHQMRTKLNQGKLSKDHERQLLDMGVRLETKKRLSTSEKLELLTKYYNKHGNIKANRGEYFEGIEIKLMMNKMRAGFNKRPPNEETRRSLDLLGFEFGKKRLSKEEKFTLLQDFFEKFGHINVSSTSKYKGQEIGGIVVTFRKDSVEGKLTDEDEALLDKMNFIYDGVRLTNNLSQTELTDIDVMNVVLRYATENKGIQGLKKFNDRIFSHLSTVMKAHKEDASSLDDNVSKAVDKLILLNEQYKDTGLNKSF